MFSKRLFHPNHVIPTAKFIPALMEFPHELIAAAGVEADAVQRKIRVVPVGIGDASVEI